MKGVKTGGRKKGTPNKSSLVVQEIAKKIGVDPLEVLMMFAAGDWEGLGYDSEVYHMEKPDGSVKMGYVITPESRLKAATEACQYIYPKKKEQTEEADDTIEVNTIEEKKLLLEQAKKEIEKLEHEIQSVENE